MPDEVVKAGEDLFFRLDGGWVRLGGDPAERWSESDLPTFGEVRKVVLLVQNKAPEFSNRPEPRVIGGTYVG